MFTCSVFTLLSFIRMVFAQEILVKQVQGLLRDHNGKWIKGLF